MRGYRAAVRDGFRSLLEVLDTLRGPGSVDVRLGGGWGVDVLAGRVTRAHRDVDVFVPGHAVDGLCRRLTAAGWAVVADARPCRAVLRSPGGAHVDVNGVAYLASGDGVQRDAAGEIEVFGAWAWVERTVAGRGVTCLSAEAQRWKHRGYPRRARDDADLAAIAHLQEPPRFDPSVRSAEPGDEELLDGIETTADRLYEPFGIWPLPPCSAGYKASERARTLATLVAGRPAVGFCRIERLDGHAHLGQLSVLPEYGRAGIGTALVEAALARAACDGDRVVTLTTYLEPPFNAPWYRRLGFEVLPPPFGPELTATAAAEEDMALLGPRVVMSRRPASGARLR